MQEDKNGVPEGHGSVENWLSRMGETTARNHRINFNTWRRWMRENGGSFSEMTPDEMIHFQRYTDNGSRYDILDVIQRYINGIQGRRLNTKKAYYSTIRSFFAHNRAELPKDPSFRVRSEVEKVRGTLTIQDIRDVALGSKPLYRAVFLSMFQGGLDLDGFEYWNTHGLDSLKARLREDPEVVRIDLPGRKGKKNEDPFYTFIGGDAIKAIRDYFRARPEGGSAIFINQYGDPVSAKSTSVYWYKHMIKAGIIVPTPEKGAGARYGKNMHEMRDVFRSQWEKTPAKASVAEYFMGHQIDPLEYNKAYRDESWTLSEYRKALPMLQIMSSGRPLGLVHLDDIYKLRQETIDNLQQQLNKQQRLIAEMLPTFQVAQRMLDQSREGKRLRESPPPDSSA